MAGGDNGVTALGWRRSLLEQTCPAPAPEHRPRVQSGTAMGCRTAAGQIQPDLSFQQSTSRYPVSLPPRLGTLPPQQNSCPNLPTDIIRLQS